MNKNETSYKKLFETLIELNGRPEPTLIKTDFEQASISAARSFFPTARISGCLFHLGQAIQRRIAEEGLRKYYNDNKPEIKYIKELMALAFVKIEDIKPLFLELYSRQTLPIELKPIYDYFFRNYSEGITTTRYPPELWSCYSTFVVERNIRTNNAVEGWHSIFKRMFAGASSSLPLLVHKLIEEQTFIEVKMWRLELDHVFERKVKYVKMEENVRAFLDTNEVTTIELVEDFAKLLFY